jgi:tryptophan synthase alpha chain
VKRIEALLGQARNRKVLVAYLCVGDPTVDESLELAKACVAAGADIVELGVPFSDPTADGPAIQRASQRAIAAGGGLEATFRVARALRAVDPKAGIVLFGYYNPLFVYGEERAVRAAAEAGADALLVVDLPPEEGASLHSAASSLGVGVVPLLAPTSSDARVALVKTLSARAQVPFVYYVSMTGVTGREGVDATEAGRRAAALRASLGLPVLVGFGIDSRDKAHAAAGAKGRADGVVVGSALVRAIEEGASPEIRKASVERIVRDLVAGLSPGA